MQRLVTHMLKLVEPGTVLAPPGQANATAAKRAGNPSIGFPKPLHLISGTRYGS